MEVGYFWNTCITKILVSGIESFLDMYRIIYRQDQYHTASVHWSIVPPLTGTSTKCRQWLPRIEFKLWNSFAQPLLHEYLPLILIIQNDKIEPWKEIGTQLLRYTVSLSCRFTVIDRCYDSLFIHCTSRLFTYSYFNCSSSSVNYSFFIYTWENWLKHNIKLKKKFTIYLVYIYHEDHL